METISPTAQSVAKEMYGQDLYEYQLVVQPGAAVHDQVMAEKRHFAEEYRLNNPRPAHPYITLSCFYAKEPMEETMIRWIERICKAQNRFTVTLNNFSGFPPHTIYLRVLNEKPFSKLSEDLLVVNHYIRSSACPPVSKIAKPHLTIAAGIPEDIFSKALPQYSRRTFHESFQANELLLLKRKDAYAQCRQVNVFRLQP